MAWRTYTDTGTSIPGIYSASVSMWDTTSNVATYNTTTTIYEWTPVQYGNWQNDNGLNVGFDIVKNKETQVIHPRLYFKYVKSKLSKLQQKEMVERLTKLQKLLVQAKDLGQKALYEELARKVAIAIKEQEINVCGIEYTIHKEAINKYREKVKGPEIGFCTLEKYSRPIPANVKKRIEKCKELKLFDNYHVLYLEYKEKTDVGGKKKEEATEKKTNKEKIKEKDPILFGTLDFLPDKFYFIIDWIDEYCDLTLDKFVEVVKKNDPEYDLDKIDDITPELLQKMVQEARDRHNRLANTNSKNFKDLMKEEDLTYMGKIVQARKKSVEKAIVVLDKVIKVFKKDKGV